MFDLIDVYLMINGRWVYQDSTRMHKTLVSAKRDYESRYRQPVRCAFAAPTIK